MYRARPADPAPGTPCPHPAPGRPPGPPEQPGEAETQLPSGVPTIQIRTTSEDGSTSVETGRIGWLGRTLFAVLALAILAVALVIAIPLVIALVVVGAIGLGVWRVRRALARRAELGGGRRNVRVVRRDP